MSLFESMEDDPLLEEDPKDDAPPPRDDGTNGASSPDLEEETIFDEEKPQVVVRSEEGLTSGQLAGLNGALRHLSDRGLSHLLDELGTLDDRLQEGWTLDRIEFRKPPAASLAFILDRPDSPENG